MGLEIGIFVLCFAILACMLLEQKWHQEERKRWEKERSTLLNRIMSSTVSDFATAEAVVKEQDPPTRWAMSKEEIQMEINNQIEEAVRGVPV